MIDLHSHILPQIDDGSQSVEESLAMLESLSSQGVETLVATPHFYANSVTVEAFLEKRDTAYRLLEKAREDSTPRLLRGAEVRYYEGISKLDGLKKLCIEGSKLLLLEMPFAKWSDFAVSELFEMSRCSGYRIVLAHIERYYYLQEKGVFQNLLENDVLFQVNATLFQSVLTRRKALSLLKKGFVHFLGSDCHDLKNRPPVIGTAYDIIKRKLGDDLVSEMIDFGYSFIERK